MNRKFGPWAMIAMLNICAACSRAPTFVADVADVGADDIVDLGVAPDIATPDAATPDTSAPPACPRRAPGWVMMGESDSFVGSPRLVVHKNNELTVIGTFAGTLTLGGKELHSPDKWGLYVARLTNMGKLLWSKAYTPLGTTHIVAATDETGNVFVSGSSIGTVHVEQYVLKSDADTPFVIKLDPTGKVVWAKQVDQAQDHRVHAIAVRDDAIALTGVYSTTNEDERVFVMRLDANGKRVWRVQTQSSGVERPYAIAVAPSGETFVCGEIERFDGYSSGGVGFGEEVVTRHPTGDSFIAAVEPNGTFAWVKTMGGEEARSGCWSLLWKNSELIASGFFRGSGESFSGDPVSGPLEGYIAALGAGGAGRWMKKVEAWEEADRIVSDSGCLLVAGRRDVKGQLTPNDGFIGAYDFKTKTRRWTLAVDGDGEEMVTALVSGDDGALYAAGMSSSTTLRVGTETTLSTGKQAVWQRRLLFVWQARTPN